VTPSADLLILLAQTVVSLLKDLPEYQRAQRISVYLSMPGEISTLDILEDAFKQEKKVFIPYIHSDREMSPPSVMEMLALRSKQDFDELKPDKWGIPSLTQESIPSRENCMGDLGRPARDQIGIEEGEGGLDLIVMPGLAFDSELHRLGHGKGYYDIFLRRYYDNIMAREQKMPFLGMVPST